jgi:hypothetical protein
VRTIFGLTLVLAMLLPAVAAAPTTALNKTDADLRLVARDSKGAVVWEAALAAGAQSGELQFPQPGSGVTLEIHAAPVPEKSSAQSLQIGELTVNVLGLKTQPSITGAFGTRAARPSAKWVLAEVSVMNRSNAPISFSILTIPSLKDSQGRVYQYGTDTVQHLENYIVGRSCAPDLEETGWLAYEVPADSTGWTLVPRK